MQRQMTGLWSPPRKTGKHVSSAPALTTHMILVKVIFTSLSPNFLLCKVGSDTRALSEFVKCLHTGDTQRSFPAPQTKLGSLLLLMLEHNVSLLQSHSLSTFIFLSLKLVKTRIKLKVIDVSHQLPQLQHCLRTSSFYRGFFFSEH